MVLFGVFWPFLSYIMHILEILSCLCRFLLFFLLFFTILPRFCRILTFFTGDFYAIVDLFCFFWVFYAIFMCPGGIFSVLAGLNPFFSQKKWIFMPSWIYFAFLGVIFELKFFIFFLFFWLDFENFQKKIAPYFRVPCFGARLLPFLAFFGVFCKKKTY